MDSPEHDHPSPGPVASPTPEHAPHAPHTAHEAHAGRPAHVAHHFDTAEQQASAQKLGMWLFLVTEMLLFSGLFCAYAVFRAMHPEVFKSASHLLDTRMGALNTVVLIGSSLTMALAVRSAQLSQNRRLICFLAVTLLLAGAFLVVKFFEYRHKFELGVMPGKYFNPNSDANINYPHARTFFSIYFLATGLHGLHVIGGMGIILWLLIRATRRAFSSIYYTPVELVGLYWHLVDIIWIFLFPLLYLIR